jgi:hypothetical protein
MSNTEINFVELSPAQDKALVLLLSGHSYTYVTEQVGIDRRTLYHWIHRDDVFMWYYKEMRERVLEETLNRRISMELHALDRIAELISSDDANISLKAASLLISRSQPG